MWPFLKILCYKKLPYFSERRRLLYNKLSNDPVRQARLNQTGQATLLEARNELPSIPVMTSASVDEPNPKKIKLVTTIEAQEKQDLFVKLFIQAFAALLA